MVFAESADQRFRGLYLAHSSAILTYFKRRTDGETAKDCTAETFLVAWRRIEDVPSDALPWLYGVARRILANQRRGGGRMGRLIVKLRGQRPESPPSPEVLVVRREEDAELVAGVSRLSVQDQELLLLANWEELPHAEIGQILGCSAHAVDQRIHRAVHRLARELGIAGQKHNGTTIPVVQSEGELP